MNNLPYIQPERELHYNLGILLIVLDCLAKTRREKRVLPIEKVQVFFFLATRPVLLNKVLSLASKTGLDIAYSDYYTVGALSENVEELFDREKVVMLIRILSSKGMITAEYATQNGFVFELTEEGKKATAICQEGYFRRVKVFVEKLRSLQSQSASRLNKLVDSALKQEA